MSVHENVMSAVSMSDLMKTAGSSLPPASLCTDQAGADKGRTATRFCVKGRKSRRRGKTFLIGCLNENCFSYRSLGYLPTRSSTPYRERLGQGCRPARYGLSWNGCDGYVQPANGHLPKSRLDRQDYEGRARREARLFGRDK